MKKFIRRDENKKKRISGGGWRKPKGITNKMRLNRKGHTPNVRPGYGTPSKSRNLVEGLEIIFITSVEQLNDVDPKKQCVVLGRAGKQKKLDMIAKADEKKIKIINLKIDKFKEDTKVFFDERKRASEKKAQVEKKKAEDAKNKTETKKGTSSAKDDSAKVDDAKGEELSDEELQKKQKEEKDKLLTKK